MSPCYMYISLTLNSLNPAPRLFEYLLLYVIPLPLLANSTSKFGMKLQATTENLEVARRASTGTGNCQQLKKCELHPRCCLTPARAKTTRPTDASHFPSQFLTTDATSTTATSRSAFWWTKITPHDKKESDWIGIPCHVCSRSLMWQIL